MLIIKRNFQTSAKGRPSPIMSNTTLITSTEDATFRYPHKIPVMIFV